MVALLWLVAVALVAPGLGEDEVEGGYKIEGKITPPDMQPANWLTVTTVTLDGGKRRAFLKEDGSFVFQVGNLKPDDFPDTAAGYFLGHLPGGGGEPRLHVRGRQGRHQLQGEAQGQEEQRGPAKSSRTRSAPRCPLPPCSR